MSSVTMLGRRTASVLAVWMDPTSPSTLPLHSHSSWNLIYQFYTFSINNCLYRFDSFEKRDVFNEFFKVSFGLGWLRMVESGITLTSQFSCLHNGAMLIQQAPSHRNYHIGPATLGPDPTVSQLHTTTSAFLCSGMVF